jgi:hypothetical protein
MRARGGGRKRVRQRVLLVAFTLAAAAGGCAALRPRARRPPNPPRFRFVEAGDIRSVMWQLAYHVNELNVALRTPGTEEDPHRAEVVRILTAMEHVTDALRPTAAATNHPLLREHLGQFRRDLALARAGAEANPPSYVMAGYVSGACLVCHGDEVL